MVSAAGYRVTMRGRALLCAVSLASWVTAKTSSAEVQGFNLDRYQPSQTGSTWFWGDSLDLRGSNRWAVGGVLDWAYKPLVSFDREGNEDVAIVEHQVFAHLGASVRFFDRLQLNASLPVLVLQQGNRTTLGTSTYSAAEGMTVGDARVGAEVAIIGVYGDPIVLATGAQIFIPTGSSRSYTGDGTACIIPHLSIAGDIQPFVYSARGGVVLRNDRSGPQDQLAADIQMGASVGLAILDKRLVIGPELWTAVAVTDLENSLFDESTAPFEGLFGGHLRVGSFQFGLGAGHGFTGAPGTPVLRVLGSIEWFPDVEAPAPEPEASPKPNPPPTDSDRDGIIDQEDACVTAPGIAAPGTTKHGCPKDTDSDGIYDRDDACPEVAGQPDKDPKKRGCPVDGDVDGDAIPDSVDACRDVVGQASTITTEHGCPSDTDQDGILNAEDACPTQAGPAAKEPAQNGCPRVQVTQDSVVILDRIEFEVNKATLQKESEPVLLAVRDILIKNPQLTHLRVEGHTDDRGIAKANVKLSQKRAEAVVAWLVAHDIAAQRLSAEGHGSSRPVDSNTTDLGRQNNRRVEFHIVKATPEAETSTP